VAEYGTPVPWKELEVIVRRKIKPENYYGTKIPPIQVVNLLHNFGHETF
jgi:hypothetical protein